MKEIERIMRGKEEQIILHHQKKNIEALKTSLNQFVKEHDSLRKDLNTVNYLLDLVDKHNIENVDSLTDEVIEHKNFSKWIEKTKLIFENFHLKHSEELNIPDKELIKIEKSKLAYEYNRLEKQINYFDAIIAKAKFLLLDIQSSYCFDLTNGHNLAAVGEKLLKKFGKTTLNYTYLSGRKEIIRFLEETYLINSIDSKCLFDLLEDSKTIKFKIDDTKLINNYCNDYISSDTLPLLGFWTINA